MLFFSWFLEKLSFRNIEFSNLELDLGICLCGQCVKHPTHLSRTRPACISSPFTDCYINVTLLWPEMCEKMIPTHKLAISLKIILIVLYYCEDTQKHVRIAGK